MRDQPAMHVRVLEREAAQVADVQVVRGLGIVAVGRDLAVVNAERRGGCVGQDRHVVAGEHAVGDRHVAAANPHAGAIALIAAGAAEAQVTHRDACLHIENADVVIADAVGDEVGHAADALDDDLVRRRREIVGVGAGIDLHGVAILRRDQRRLQRGEGTVDADLQHMAAGHHRAGPAVIDI